MYKRQFLSSTDDSEVLIDNLTDCSISVTTDLRDTTTKIYLLFTHAPDGTENAGDERFDVSGYITSLELSGGTEDNGTFTCTVEVHDTIVRESIPA